MKINIPNTVPSKPLPQASSSDDSKRQILRLPLNLRPLL